MAETTFWYRVTRRVLRFIVGCFVRVEITGLEKLPVGNYILVSNHLRWIDPFLYLLFFPLHPRISFMGASELTEGIWWRRKVCEFGGVIPVDRTQRSASRALIHAVLEVLNNGGTVGIFPEGGEGTVEGQLRGRLKRGAALFAVKTGKPIVPVGISGTKELFLGKRICLNVAEPIDVAGLEEEAVQNALTERLAAAIPPIHPAQPIRRRLEHFMTYLLDEPD